MLASLPPNNTIKYIKFKFLSVIWASIRAHDRILLSHLGGLRWLRAKRRQEYDRINEINMKS